MLYKLIVLHGLDSAIISGKLGMITPDEIVHPYDQKIQDTKDDISRVQALTLDKLSPLIERNDIIFVVMGNTYRKVVEPLINEKFIILTHKKGIFGYISTVSKLLKLSKRELIRELLHYKEFGTFTFEQPSQEGSTHSNLMEWT